MGLLLMKTKYKVRLLILLAVIFVIVLLHYSGIKNYFTLENIKMQRDWVMRMVRERYCISVLVYLSILTIAVTAALPVAAFLTVAAGYFFGMWHGLLYACIGATLGSVILFLLVRYLLGTYVQERYKDKLHTFNAAVHRYGTIYLLAIHWILVLPLFVVNILAGLTRVSLWTFTWTTVLGIIPSALVYSFAGQQLTEIHSVKDIFTPHILMAFGFLALFAVVSMIGAHWWQNKFSTNSLR